MAWLSFGILWNNLSSTLVWATLPWEYEGFSSFPALFFGASPEGYESNSTMSLALKHQIVGWGWQQNNTGIPGTEEENLLKQAKYFDSFQSKQTNNNDNINNMSTTVQSKFVYRSGYAAAPYWNTSINMPNEIIYNPNYSDFWMKDIYNSDKNKQNNICWQGNQPIWNFTNESAINYYMDNVINQVINSYKNTTYINSIFFDMCDWISCDFDWIKLTNCTGFVNTSNQLTINDKIKHGRAALELFYQITVKLNKYNIIPSISIRTLMNKTSVNGNDKNYMLNYTSCVISEEEWINKLNGLQWFRYQEYWPHYGHSRNDSITFLNQIEEMKYVLNNNIPGIQVHAYNVLPYMNKTIDPFYIATFLISQTNYSYFGSSNGWYDDNWSWHQSYDKKYGIPKSMPINLDQNGTKWFRQFTNCNVTVDINQRKGLRHPGF